MDFGFNYKLINLTRKGIADKEDVFKIYLVLVGGINPFSPVDSKSSFINCGHGGGVSVGLGAKINSTSGLERREISNFLPSQIISPDKFAGTV